MADIVPYDIASAANIKTSTVIQLAHDIIDQVLFQQTVDAAAYHRSIRGIMYFIVAYDISFTTRRYSRTERVMDSPDIMDVVIGDSVVSPARDMPDFPI